VVVVAPRSAVIQEEPFQVNSYVCLLLQEAYTRDMPSLRPSPMARPHTASPLVPEMFRVERCQLEPFQKYS
jgi:hypothetical protein